MATGSDNDKDIQDLLPEPLQSEEALHDPFDWYREQRETAPVQYDPKRTVYDVFSYEHVNTGLQEAEALQRKQLSGSHTDGQSPFSYLDRGMVWSDGPDHKQTKGQLFKYFQPGLLAELEESIEALCEAQLETALEDGTRFDFVTEFADPVPLRVIMDVVGIPGDEHQQMLDWLNTFRAVMNSEYSAAGSRDEHKMEEPVEYFQDLVAERTANPQDDLISELAHESELSDATIGANCFDFLLAGQGTMSELLSNALYLFEHHDITGESHELSVVLEEVLRYRSPLQSRARETTESVTLGGTEIPASETVILWIGAANRDPAQYETPEQFVPDRNPDHLAFGSGPHNCIGAPLARLEAPIIMRTVLEYFAEIELLEEEATPMSKASKVGFQTLPIETTLA